MTTTATQHTVVAIPLGELTQVSLIGNLKDFAADLMGLQGHQFLKFSAEYDMDAKGKMLKTGNPFIGKGLIKQSTTTATVNFDYESKVERREGEETENKGTWHTVVLMGGKVTPVSVHKADVVTEPDPDAMPNPKTGEYRLADLRAVLDDNGNTQFTTDQPRLYLRYEIVRTGEAEDRNKRKMQSNSAYLLNGEEIDVSDVKPYLPNRKPRTDQTDMQLTALGNLTELHAGGKIYKRVV